MNQILFKWATKAFFQKPMRTIFTTVLTLVSLTVSAVAVCVAQFDWFAYEKEYYYSDSFAFQQNEKYMDFIWEYGYGLPVFDTNLNNFKYEVYSRSVAEEIMQTLDKNVDIGFFISNGTYGQRFYPNYHGEIEELWGEDVKEQHLFGMYHLSEYVGLSPQNPINNKDIPDRFLDDEGKFAPYVAYDYLGIKQHPRSYSTFFSEVVCFQNMDEHSLDLYGYRLHGRLPENIGEVVIPSCLFQSFVSYGYQNASIRPYVKETIKTYGDIIGKELRLCGFKVNSDDEIIPVKIVGVMEYDYEAENFMKYIYPNANSLQEIPQSVLESGQTGGQIGICATPIFSVIVHEDYFKKYSAEKEYVKRISILKQGDHADFCFDYATKWFQEHPYSRWMGATPEGHISYFNVQARNIRNYTVTMTTFISDFTFIVYILLVFTILVNVLQVIFPLYEQRKKIYLLRSFGTTNRQIYGSLFCVLGTYLTICALISVGLCAIALKIMTKKIFEILNAELSGAVPLFHFSALSVVAIFGVVLLSIVVSFFVLWFVQRKQSDLERLTANEKEKKKV